MSCPHKQQLLQPLKVVNDVVFLILEFIQSENPIISQILDHLQLLEVLLMQVNFLPWGNAVLGKGRRLWWTWRWVFQCLHNCNCSTSNDISTLSLSFFADLPLIIFIGGGSSILSHCEFFIILAHTLYAG